MSTDDGKIHFSDLISKYDAAQKQVAQMVTSLAKNTSNMQPGKFLLLQFKMGNLSQIGDSLSNVISSMNAICKNSISNMRG